MNILVQIDIDEDEVFNKHKDQLQDLPEQIRIHLNEYLGKYMDARWISGQKLTALVTIK